MKHLIILSAIASLAPVTLHATILTFDTSLTSQPVPQTYGDNVTAAIMGSFSYGSAQGFTPNVTTTYGGISPSLFGGGYGNLTNVLYEANTSSVLSITLSAETGFLARLHSLDLAAYSPYFITGATIDSLTVFNSLNAPVFSQANVLVSASLSTPITFAAPLTDTSLRIEINSQNLGARADGIAVDNVVFSQISVPEPSSVGLVAVGALLMSLRRFSKRSAYPRTPRRPSAF